MPDAQHHSVEQKGHQHEYMIWPVENLDIKEELEVQNQIQSITGEKEAPYSWGRKFKAGIRYWVINATPDVAEEIKNLPRVLAIQKEIRDPSEEEIARWKADRVARGLDPNEPMWAG